jgi:hypothetical protein
MPTHEEEPQFLREFVSLTSAQRARFQDAVRKMVNDMRAGQPYRPGLRMKGVLGHAGVFEMTWADDGRATFEYGPEQIPGERHIVWRRIGDHDILKQP